MSVWREVVTKIETLLLQVTFVWQPDMKKRNSLKKAYLHVSTMAISNMSVKIVIVFFLLKTVM